ncbi:MAG: glutamyl-tRNA reductase [Candidatus Omnitrophota bacterium]
MGEILVLGLNHKTAPLELRERLSVPAHKAPDFLKSLEERSIFEERVLLSTCNRTEIYGAGKTPERSIRLAKEFLSEYARLDLGCFEENLYILRQPASIEHLFSVASGLDSMVLGETEIAGQVKDAYFSAHRTRQTGKILNTLFQRSFKVAKNVRTQTRIGSGRVSVASVAVDLAEKIFESLKGVRVMVIGTGEMSTQVARAMISKGARPMIVSSRHLDRAEELAAELGGEAIGFDHYEERIGQTDIVIASTLAPKIIIHGDQVKEWMRVRHERPLFLIDIAVPRNIDAAIEKLDNVYLYNIDDLQSIAGKNRALRENELEECLRLINHHRRHFTDWLERSL